MRYLADSTFVIDCLTRRPHALHHLPRLLREGLAVSIISHMELWEGVYGSRDPKRAGRELRQFLRRVRILPFSHQLSPRAAALRWEMRGLGLPVQHRTLDILIAATALHHRLTIVTSDADFADIPGLTLFNSRTS